MSISIWNSSIVQWRQFGWPSVAGFSYEETLFFLPSDTHTENLNEAIKSFVSEMKIKIEV